MSSIFGRNRDIGVVFNQRDEFIRWNIDDWNLAREAIKIELRSRNVLNKDTVKIFICFLPILRYVYINDKKHKNVIYERNVTSVENKRNFFDN